MYSLLHSLNVARLDWNDGFADSLGFDAQGNFCFVGRVGLVDALDYSERPGVEMRWPNGRTRLRPAPRMPGATGIELWA